MSEYGSMSLKASIISLRTCPRCNLTTCCFVSVLVFSLSISSVPDDIPVSVNSFRIPAISSASESKSGRDESDVKSGGNSRSGA